MSISAEKNTHIYELFKPYNGTFTLKIKYDLEAVKTVRANYIDVCSAIKLSDKGEVSKNRNLLDKLIRSNKSEQDISYVVKKGYGRLYAKSVVSYLCFKKAIRYALASEMYYDVDMENCHPVIIEHLYEQLLNKPSKHFKYYNEHRCVVLKTIMDVCGVDRDIAKTLTYAFLYGGSVDKFFKDTHPKLWKAIENGNEDAKSSYILANCVKDEVNELIDAVKSRYPSLWDCLPYDKSKKNIDAGKFSTLVQNCERKIIMKVVEKLIELGIPVGDIQHDGIYINKETDYSIDDICKLMMDVVKKQFDMDVTFCKKHFERPAWYDLLTVSYDHFIGSSKKTKDMVKEKMFEESCKADEPVVVTETERDELVKLLDEPSLAQWNDDKEKRIETLYFLAYHSNPSKYEEIRLKYYKDKRLYSALHEDVAQTFFDFFGFNYILLEEHYYYYNGRMWNDDGLHYLRVNLKKMVSLQYKYIAQLSQEASQLVADGKNDEAGVLSKKIECSNMVISSLKTNSFIKNVCDMIKDMIYIKDIELENDPYLFAFKDKLFSLKSMEWVDKTKPESFMFKHTGYEWVEPSSEKVEDLNILINKIFPVEKERDTYLTILASALFGQTIERFIVANGSGGNGKGVLNELMTKMMGNYAYECSNNVLLKPLKEGANPEVAHMNHKRLVIYREPDERQEICVATIKELTGGSSINARLCHSNDTKIKMKATHILECNKRLNLNGRVDNSIQRRLIDVPFRSTFVTNKDDCLGDHVYDADSYYKTNEFKEDYKCALFVILLPYWKQLMDNKMNLDMFVSQTIKDRTNEYLMDTDELKTWFDEFYTFTGDKVDVIKISDMFDLFKDGEWYSNLSKKDKRKHTKKYFLELVTTNIHLKKCYKEEVRSKAIREKYDVVKMRNVLIGYKLSYMVDASDDILTL